MSKRRKFTPEFKAQVVLAILSGSRTTAEICREYQLREQVIIRWKNKLIENAASIFESEKTNNDEQSQVVDLERLIGRLTVENEVLKKASNLLSLANKKSGRY